MTTPTISVTATVWVCRGIPLAPARAIPDSTISEPWYTTQEECALVCAIFNEKAQS